MQQSRLLRQLRRPALAAAGARMPPPRYSAETEAFARSKGSYDTEEGSAAFIFEKVMTSRLELLGWACRDREDSDTYDLERWTANCGGDAAMARRVVAEARARVQRHVLERPFVLLGLCVRLDFGIGVAVGHFGVGGRHFGGCTGVAGQEGQSRRPRQLRASAGYSRNFSVLVELLRALLLELEARGARRVDALRLA